MEGFWDDFEKKFTMAFLTGDRWKLYLKGMGTTLELTACALVIGVVLGVFVAVIRSAHDQQRPGKRNFALGVVNVLCKLYTTVIRGTPCRCSCSFGATWFSHLPATAFLWVCWVWASTRGPTWRRSSGAA